MGAETGEIESRPEELVRRFGDFCAQVATSEDAAHLFSLDSLGRDLADPMPIGVDVWPEPTNRLRYVFAECIVDPENTHFKSRVPEERKAALVEIYRDAIKGGQIPAEYFKEITDHVVFGMMHLGVTKRESFTEMAFEMQILAEDLRSDPTALRRVAEASKFVVAPREYGHMMARVALLEAGKPRSRYPEVTDKPFRKAIRKLLKVAKVRSATDN